MENVFDKQLNLIVTCASGIEKATKKELERLGFLDTQAINGEIAVNGDGLAVAKLNVNLRTADRVYIKIAEFNAETFDELFDGVNGVRWEDYFPKNAKIIVNGKCVRSKLFAISACQSIVKKAIVERLKSEYGSSWFSEEGTKMQIEFFLLNDRVTLLIDTSGAPLYKRGYRKETGEAPIRETLAAAMCRIARPREDVLFWDPFCGSGTIPIEATLMMKNIAPGSFRHFLGEEFLDLPESIWIQAREEARDLVKKTDFEAFASDLDPNMVSIAKINAEAAGVEDRIRFFPKNALGIETHGRKGTIVCNPPYGERLESSEEAIRLYRAMGAHWKNLDSWQIYVITSHEQFQEHYGRRADNIRKLYNGMLKCFYFQFYKPKQNRFSIEKRREKK